MMHEPDELDTVRALIEFIEEVDERTGGVTRLEIVPRNKHTDEVVGIASADDAPRFPLECLRPELRQVLEDAARYRALVHAAAEALAIFRENRSS